MSALHQFVAMLNQLLQDEPELTYAIFDNRPPIKDEAKLDANPIYDRLIASDNAEGKLSTSALGLINTLLVMQGSDTRIGAAFRTEADGTEFGPFFKFVAVEFPLEKKEDA